MKIEHSGYDASAEFYDYTTLYVERSDIEFYLNEADDLTGSILELGCGTGRILIPLAKAGHHITGIDSSESMLGACRRKLNDETAGTRERVTLINGRMQDFSLNQLFGLVTVPFRAFQHLETTDDQLACLDCIRKHMSDGSTFILDLFNPSMKYILDESRRNEFGDEPSFSMPDGRTVTRRMRNPSIDLAKQLIECEIIYYSTFPDGTTERTVHPFILRYIHRFEAEHLLERAGFRVRDVLGDFDGTPFGTRWPGELIIKAELK